MPTINRTNFNGNGKFHKCLVRAIALVFLSFIAFSLGTVITAPALALRHPWCEEGSGLPGCSGGFGGGGSDTFLPPIEEPNPKPPKEPKEPKEPQPKEPKKPQPKTPSQPQPKPPSQPESDPYVCNKKPYLPQCN